MKAENRRNSIGRRERTVWWGAFWALIGVLYGPKLGGVVDLSIVFSVVAWAILLIVCGGMRISVKLVAPMSIMLLAFVYISAISIAKGVPDSYVVLRMLRALLSSFALAMSCYTLTSRGLIRVDGTVNVIISSLVVLVVSMLIQVIFPGTQGAFAAIYGFNKGLRELRAFGLTSGYDTAGYLAAVVSVVALMAYLIRGRFVYMMISCAGGVAVLCSSRSSMVLFFALMCLTFVVSPKNLFGGVARALPLLVLFAVAVVFYVAPLFLSTFIWFGEHMGGWGGQAVVDYTTQFARTSIEDGYGRMWLLPNSLAERMVGSGVDIRGSDIGYVKMVFMGGVLFLGVALLFYCFLFCMARSELQKTYSCQLPNERDFSRVLQFILLVLIIVMFAGNLKNLYFFTRSYHELFVVVGSSSIGLAHYYRRRSARAYRCS